VSERNRPGMLIVLEGVEGSGKTTQAKLLGEWIERRGLTALVTREPGGTILGEEIRRLVLHAGDVPARSEVLLVLAARAAHLELEVRPALQAGKIVVADRYELSTLAYQGYGRGLQVEQVRQLNAFATDGLRPDITIVLDVQLAVGARRRAASRPGEDRIERAGDAFHQRVAEAYRQLAHASDDVVTIDGAPPADEVHRSIIRLLAERFSETFPIEPG
jgi:dTMP kinase